MQCSFGTSPCSNDEAVCLVDSVESHVPEEDDIRNGHDLVERLKPQSALAIA